MDIDDFPEQKIIRYEMGSGLNNENKYLNELKFISRKRGKLNIKNISTEAYINQEDSYQIDVITVNDVLEEYNTKGLMKDLVIKNIYPLLQDNFGEVNDCTLTSITTAIKFFCPLIQTELIYSMVEMIAKQYFYIEYFVKQHFQIKCFEKHFESASKITFDFCKNWKQNPI